MSDRSPLALLDLPAPAKLNLFLHVTGRRADGYHTLETVFQRIDLQDRIDLHLRTDGVIQRADTLQDLPADDCLTVRAARRLKQASGTSLGVDITLHKHIPHGAGLGGGSSDAATVLLGLQRLWSLSIPPAELRALGNTLGADVPVFLYGEDAYATGTGDQLEAIPLPPTWFVLLKPPVNIPTVDVFRAPDLTRGTTAIRIMNFSRAYIARRNSKDLPGRNDLEPVVLARYPLVRSFMTGFRQAVNSVRCEGDGWISNPRMSGSGSSLFSATDSVDAAWGLAARLVESGLGSCLIPPGGLDMPAGTCHRLRANGVSDTSSSFGSVIVVAGLSQRHLGSRQVG